MVCRPVTWNSGMPSTAPGCGPPATGAGNRPVSTAAAASSSHDNSAEITARCEETAPFGAPVEPEV
jgi:hypothetical protein